MSHRFYSPAVLRVAFSNTCEHLHSWGVAATIAALTLAVMYLWYGTKAASDEIPAVVAGLVALALSVVAVFLYDLVRAPAQIRYEYMRAADLTESQRESDSLTASADRVPWYFRQIITFHQCRIFPSSPGFIQVQFPWPLRCAPTIRWAKSGRLAEVGDAVAISACDNQSATVTLKGYSLEKLRPHEVTALIREGSLIFDASSREALKTAAQKLNIEEKEVVEFVTLALTDPKKGYPFLSAAVSA